MTQTSPPPKNLGGRPKILTQCPLCKNYMGRALLRVHIARCKANYTEITEQDECLMFLERALEIEPRLCYYGLGVYDGKNLVYRGRKFEESRDRLQNAIHELIACEAWLVQQKRTKKVTMHHSSYGLKHIVERTAKRYIANGVLCAMAIGMGFKYTVDGPNIFINIAKDLYCYDGTPVA